MPLKKLNTTKAQPKPKRVPNSTNGTADDIEMLGPVVFEGTLEETEVFLAKIAKEKLERKAGVESSPADDPNNI